MSGEKNLLNNIKLVEYNMITVSSCEKVCIVVNQIPSGFVASYGQVADLAGFPRGARMVSKCLKNSSKTIPWHRVIKSNGTIAFPSQSEKFYEQVQALIKEGVILTNNRIDMRKFRWKPELDVLLHRLSF